MIDTREEITRELECDLMGPRNDFEELSDLPTRWYICGILFPQNTDFDPEDDDTIEAGQDDSETEGQLANESVPRNSSFRQNSIGISCYVKPSVTQIEIDVRYGVYEKKIDNKINKAKWFRKPIEFKTNIQLEHITGKIQLHQAKLTWSIESEENLRILTVFLYNDQNLGQEKVESNNNPQGDNISMGFTDLINTLSIFQPQITIKSTNNTSPFPNGTENVNLELDSGLDMDDSEKSLQLLYRKKSVYARGFSCATEWERSDDPLFVKTKIIPVFNSKSPKWSSNNDDTKPKDIDMKLLADAKSPVELVRILSPLADLYEKWIERISSEVNKERSVYGENSPSWSETADAHIEKCKHALERIREGISLFEKRADVFEAFKFANRSMLYQRAHYQYAIAKFRGSENIGTKPEVGVTGKYFWRPFQIAFFLVNLKGIADPNSDERQIADLLWFPTGGGKTEAYLGLTAFTLALRRINGRNSPSGGNGVAVIMRYTLRLLTIQQFQRAAAMICACEIMRRQNPGLWGEQSFLIGLWVGYRSTPNDFDTASSNLRDLKIGKPLREGNPVQLSFCPWCGAKISYRNFHADSERQWILVHCHNPGCDFYHSNPSDTTRALPILTVDQDIYRRCPSMIVSTVDKFARMPWRPQSASIFGYVSRHCPVHGYLTAVDSDHQTSHTGKDHKRIVVNPVDPLQGPDLIIQDELHLIAGPLGTMTGLYETAVEYLSSRKNSSSTYFPKIIVSTATIKGVDYQVRKLFNRKRTETFPPPGINYDDTFFYWEVDEDGRKFVGVTSPSYSIKFAIARIYASILQRVAELAKTDGDKIDPYWTLVGYFNSRRELGGSLRLLEDDVVRRIDNIVDMVEDHIGSEKRTVSKNKELTGRIDSAEISPILSELENKLDSGNAIDVLLATNMISVGIDVDRLGLMVVNGQPKSTAEYIQAVGRVGRKHGSPGLIVTLYNAYRPRDLSHYENFIGYHSMLHRFVDHVSLTPFSDRAIDRALHAVIISMIRLRIPQLSARQDAQSFRADHPILKDIVTVIEERFIDVEGTDRSKNNFFEFTEEIKKIFEHWEKLLNAGRRLAYSKKNPRKDIEPGENVLMRDIGEENVDAFLTPGSMRDVEKEAHLYYY